MCREVDDEHGPNCGGRQNSQETLVYSLICSNLNQVKNVDDDNARKTRQGKNMRLVRVGAACHTAIVSHNRFSGADR